MKLPGPSGNTGSPWLGLKLGFCFSFLLKSQFRFLFFLGKFSMTALEGSLDNEWVDQKTRGTGKSFSRFEL